MSEPAGGTAGGGGEALSEEQPSAVCVVLTVAIFRVGSVVFVHIFPLCCVIYWPKTVFHWQKNCAKR